MFTRVKGTNQLLSVSMVVIAVNGACGEVFFSLFAGYAINIRPKDARIMAQPTAVNLPAKPAESQAEAGPFKEQPEIASAFCPSCSARLAQRSCKLICPTCGYYMSCSDFY
jgi:hypothetical protein